MVRPITIVEFNTVLKENDKLAGLYSELSKYLRIAGNTGLRVSEVLSIKLNQLYDVENNQPIKTLKISKKNLKGGKKEKSTVVARYIPLSDELTSYVTNYIKHKSDNDPTTLDYKSKFISVTFLAKFFPHFVFLSMTSQVSEPELFFCFIEAENRSRLFSILINFFLNFLRHTVNDVTVL
jgi:integrase